MAGIGGQKLKESVKVPVIVASRMEVPELAEQALAEGKADMIAIGRGLLTDAEWASKVMTGRIDRIRPCIGCHDGSHKKTTSHYGGRYKRREVRVLFSYPAPVKIWPAIPGGRARPVR